MLKVGDKFPVKTLPNQDNELVSTSSSSGKPFIVYFYPKDNTSGCTKEACEFREAFPRFKGINVIGVSPDSPQSHKKFAEKYSLPFTLIADENHELAEECGVWVKKSMYGKEYMGVQRSTFLVDGKGVIRKVWEKVNPEGHAEQILTALKELN